MNQTRILQAFVGRLSSKALATLVDAAENAEHASQQLGTNSQLAAYHQMTQTIEGALETLTDHDRDLITEAVEREASGIAALFERFQQTRQKCTLGDLVGELEADTYAENQNLDPEDTEVYAYCGNNGIPELFIEIRDNNKVALVIKDSVEQYDISELEYLERKLFNHACSIGAFD